MENILLLAIFTYPGAMADWIYSSLAKDSSFYKEHSDTLRVARDFFISVVISGFTMFVLVPAGENSHTLSNWMKLLSETDYIWKYLIASAINTSLYAFAWYVIRRFLFWLSNRIKTKSKVGYPEGLLVKTWNDMVNSRDVIDFTQTVLIVRNSDNSVIVAGIPFTTPSDIEIDPGLALMWTDRVRAELTKPDNETLIDHVAVLYYDPRADRIFEFRYAPRLIEAMVNENKGSA